MHLHHISLELTLGVQNSLFQVFNTLVRASPESREAVLQYFAWVINLNVKRAGLQVGEDIITTESFTVNLQTVHGRELCEGGRRLTVTLLCA